MRDKWFLAFPIIWLIWAALGLAFWGSVIYVAWHFISKYW